MTVNEKRCHQVGIGKKQRAVEVRRPRHLTTFYFEPNLSRRILAIQDRDSMAVRSAGGKKGNQILSLSG